ncbi:MAG: flagellar protein [Lachnospiraceae bacterium]|nr:flagellar protein [Lachnospiraceae bacterium]
MDRLQNSFMTIDQVKDAYFNQSRETTKKNVSEELDFKQILERTREDGKSVNNVTFSKHANERLESRNISLSDDQMLRLNRGIMQAREKSINESLVMMDNIAFIVNVNNNTVITAMEQQTTDSNVFTNIDGAVIV